MSENQSSQSADNDDIYIKGKKYSPPFANEPDDYKNLRKRQELKREELLASPKRFQRISEREDRSDTPPAYNKCESAGRHLARYRGFDICKCPVDFVLYQQLFGLVKPKTVIELGTLSGGNAIWIADTLKLFDISAHVYSMDLDISNRSEIVNKLKPENVTFLQGDAYEIEKTFTDEFLKSLPHPWVFIEDAHVNIPIVFQYLHQYFKVGDYLICEDTSPDIPKELGMFMGNNEDFVKMGRKQLGCFKDFLKEYEDFYAVDSFITDLFGYNCSWHWHGFVRRMN
ncbi:uncharacterized protein LOC114531651 [Dendronephthya gigantea]|uniref:uncharacterized protein LOC114531651 n=1 Tax=Dendronephthya gigantea TaxID=151771 RepID=UPI0010691C47|nr:uncharacterized protein LOC114531651 [Dendronephthya gigantea]